MAGIAVLGFGVVGSGVVEVIEENREMLETRAGRGLFVKYILDVRDFPGDKYAHLLTKDFSKIENDPEVEIVVETIGGRTFALDFTRRALAAGKSVVTSNKELVSEHAVELFELARQNGVSYLFEASVGGGIPVINPIGKNLSANEITEVCGILNGTTNYILTKMEKKGQSFEAALKDAQALGYAEQNADADVKGLDTCRKICILSGLAFGRHIDPALVKVEGITKITAEDFEFARMLGMKIKLLGRAVKTESGALYISVAPHLVELSSPLCAVNDVFNAVTVCGSAVGTVMFYGPGAGKLPTASAVVADVVDAARSRGDMLTWGPAAPGSIAECRRVRHDYFVRAASGAAKKAVLLFEDIEVLETPSGDDEAFIIKDIPEGELFDKLEILGPAVKNRMMFL